MIKTEIYQEVMAMKEYSTFPKAPASQSDAV